MSNSGKTTADSKSKIFHGYWILAISVFCLGLFSGSGVGVFSLFVTNLQTGFGWGRGEIMLAFTIYYLLTGLAAPVVGWLVDRYGVREVITSGSLLASLGFISLYALQGLWHLYTAYFFIGIGHSAIGQVSTSAMVSNWFVRRRGTAIGIMSTGIGLGILLLAPLVGSFLIPTFGRQVSYAALGLFNMALIPLAIFVVRTRPSDMGLHPDGIVDDDDNARVETLRLSRQGLSLKIALGTSAFWFLCLTFLISGFSSMGVLQNQVPHLQDKGFSLALATSSVTGLGLGSAVGKFFFGWLCDIIKAKYACALSIVLLATATVVLILIRPGAPPAIIWLYAIVFGLGAGGWLPTMSMLVNRNFGLASFGAILGMISLAQAIGVAAGPFFGGYMYDAMATYHWAFIIMVSLYAIAIPAVLTVRRPKSFV
ncbi:MAG TPA: MFS transporter [Dehalococcoidia bacterium]|nr:MFS transporter [Dehalococcoidia bacterium]